MSKMRTYNPKNYGGTIWIDRAARALVAAYAADEPWVYRDFDFDASEQVCCSENEEGMVTQ